MKKFIVVAMVLVALITLGGAYAVGVFGGPFANSQQTVDASVDPVYYNELGYFLAGQGNAAGAQLAFTHAVALDAQYANARSNLATIAFQNGDYTTAIEQLRWLTTAYPFNGNYHFDLAQNLASQARYGTKNQFTLLEAVQEFDTAAAFGVAHASENAKVVRNVIANMK